MFSQCCNFNQNLRSLGALSDVISALATGQRNIPYRNSKLTFLLQDALKPHSKVLMFVNISPSPEHTGESLASLQFASRCRFASGNVYRTIVMYVEMWIWVRCAAMLPTRQLLQMQRISLHKLDSCISFAAKYFENVVIIVYKYCVNMNVYST